MTATLTPTLAQQAAGLATIRGQYEKYAARAAQLKADLDEAEHRLFERMESENVPSIGVGDTNFVRAETVYGQVQDRSEFVAWAEANAPELVEVKERKARVNELVREALDGGAPMPPGLGFYTKQYVSQRARRNS